MLLFPQRTSTLEAFLFYPSATCCAFLFTSLNIDRWLELHACQILDVRAGMFVDYVSNWKGFFGSPDLCMCGITSDMQMQFCQ